MAHLTQNPIISPAYLSCTILILQKQQKQYFQILRKQETSQGK